MDSVDFKAVRHRVKLLRETGDARLFENRDGVACPVCGDAFEEALATRERTRRLRPDADRRLCLLREADRLVVFTHAGGRRS